MKHALAASALLLSACTSTREVTPWLRTTRTVPFRLLAESGGAGGYDKTRAERKEGGRWVVMADFGDGAFAFAGGTRAVIMASSLVILRPDGSTIPTGCGGELRGTPDGAELVCVEVFSRISREGPPETVRVTRIDAEGRTLGQRSAPYPIPTPPGTPILAMDADPSLLGFLPEGLVFSARLEEPDTSYAEGAVKTMRVFLLRADGGWQDLGSMPIRVGELWGLHFPRLWNQAKGGHVELGRIPRDARGEPNP